MQFTVCMCMHTVLNKQFLTYVCFPFTKLVMNTYIYLVVFLFAPDIVCLLKKLGKHWCSVLSMVAAASASSSPTLPAIL